MTIPAKNSVAIVIENERGEFLAVKRPENDDSLPGVWGLPAASLRRDETPEQAAIRAAQEKLGISAEVLAYIGEESIDRGSYVNRLAEYRVRILDGEPSVPQADRTVTQYVDLRYTADYSLLFEAAQKGSLCSRIYLRTNRVDWR